MADDPNRDLLPVREDSVIETFRSSAIDPRERHAVCKLDRYELEDRYLRMHDEILELKKLSNVQEDKIKRLATKLMRASANPRSCLATSLDSQSDRNRLENLELENAKLKDKITVLRNQILNHRIGVGRSPSRARRLKICSSSGPTTCRSDMGRIPSSSSHLIRDNDRDDDKDAKNYLIKIEKLEAEKKEMSSKIENLECQLLSHEAGNQRQKVAENVEFIRVWRQMKLQNEKIVEFQAEKASLEQQIRSLKELVDEKSRNNRDITSALLTEKKRLSDMDEQLMKATNSQMSLREKDEQIRDMMNEMKILHNHNAELIALSTKYSNVEAENIELRNKISEQLSDHLSLKSAFSNEQANIVALQAANQQLMTKLHELQRNIDSLTVQLKSFQSQGAREKWESERRVVKTIDRQTSTSSMPEKSPSLDDKISITTEICANCCESSREKVNRVDRQIQTDDDADRAISGGETSPKKYSAQYSISKSPIRERTFQHENGNLTPVEMIELLEKSQINTPLNSRNIARIGRIESSSGKNFDTDSRHSCSSTTKTSQESLVEDTWQILLVLHKILREHEAKYSTIILEKNSTHPSIEQLFSGDEKNQWKFGKESTGEKYRRKISNGENKHNRERHENDECWENENCANFEDEKNAKTTNCNCESDRVCDEVMHCRNACDRSISLGKFVDSDKKKINRCCCEKSSEKSFDSLKRRNRAKVKLSKASMKFLESFILSNESLNIGKSKVRKCQKICGDGPIVGESNFCPMMVTQDQGLLEVHVISLQLASMAASIMRKEKMKSASLFVSWDIWNQQTARTPYRKYPKFDFYTSAVYRLPNLQDFFRGAYERPVPFEIRISRPKKPSFSVARAYLSIRDIFDYPQNKLHYIANFSSISPCSRDQHFGQLTLWLRISCDLSKLEVFKKTRGIDRASFADSSNSGRDKISKDRKKKNSLGPKKTLISPEPSENDAQHAKNLKIEKILDTKYSATGKQEFESSSRKKLNNQKLSGVLQSNGNGNKRVTSVIPPSNVGGSPLNSPLVNIQSLNSYQSTSRETFILKSSASSLTSTMDVEDTTSEENQKEKKENDAQPLEKFTKKGEVESQPKNNQNLDAASVREFNNFIRNKTNLSPRESRSSMRDLGTVFRDENWQEYRKRSMFAHAKSRKLSTAPISAANEAENSYPYANNHSTNSYDAVIIRIKSLSLIPKCSLLENPEVRRLYIEFTFLEYRGAELETTSVDKPKANTKAYFNYMKKFEFDKEEHMKQRNIIRAMMTEEENPMVKFVVVSEPLLEEMETKECVDVGYAYFNIREHVLKNHRKDIELQVMNIDETEPVGFLNITLLGSEAIRRCLAE